MPPAFLPLASTVPSNVQPVTEHVPSALSRVPMMPPTKFVPFTVAWLTQFSMVPWKRPAKEPIISSVPV